MKIGLIGCGSIAQVHVKCISAIGGDIRLTSVADCDFGRAEKMAREYGAAAYRDWRELLERDAPDIVHICTPHHLHTPMAREALRRGIHVFTEKPPVISWEQLAELSRAVTDSGEAHAVSDDGAAYAASGGGTAYARLAVCFQNRLNPGVRYVKELLDGGSLGRLTGLRGFVTWRREAPYYTQSPWRGKKDTEGGGALINQGIHTLDLMQYFAGCAPRDVDAVQGNFHLAGKTEVEDTLAAYIRYPDARAVFYATTAYAADVPPLVELQCERGTIRMEDDEVLIRREGAALEKVQFPMPEGYGKKYWGAAHRDAIEGFYKSVADGSRYLLDFDNVEETLRLTLRIYDAAGRREQEAGTC